jgi:hypothetical protein
MAWVSVGVLGVAALVACGGGGGSSPAAPAPVPTPVASAAVTASGAGFVVIHPSRYSSWSYALETPIRLRETGGGRAKWNYARLSLVLGGREIERSEIGADVLSAAPDWSSVAAGSDVTRALVFRLNSDRFDRVDITLGFSDVGSGRQFTVDVPFSSFSGVDVSIVAMSVPAGGTKRLP